MNQLLAFHDDSAANGRRLQSARSMRLIALLVFVVLALARIGYADAGYIDQTGIRAIVDDYTAANKDVPRDRFERGVRQAAGLWREEDGSPADFARFCKENLIADSALSRQTAEHLETAFESIDGHFQEMGRDLSWNLDVETGPILPIDYILGQYSPYAHFDEDMFKTKISFIILLNYPQYRLDDLLRLGPSWTSERWMQARLAGQFEARIPPEVSQLETKVSTETDDYINRYNIYMHHLLTPDGQRPFPKGLRLVSHWNLRDELKSLYSAPDGLNRQRMIYDVMGRIIRQEIPAVVINNPAVDWTLATNRVTISPIVDGPLPADWKETGQPGAVVDNSPEPLTRYAYILSLFHAQQEVDKYYPSLPTLMDRIFQREREIPEARVEQMLVSILGSEAVAKIGNLIEKRLGRPLEPFDIWYDGFKVRASIDQRVLDSLVKAKYPTVQAFQTDLATILRTLGFDAKTTELLMARITVDPSRGIGHAASPGPRVHKAHLRTRFTAGGMDYKGYNIAVHEFGHNVEQVLSLNRVDHTLLRGVPNTAFTEAFAFVFQSQDLRLLGFTDQAPDAKYLEDIDALWEMYEISGPALVDMKMWRWMYAHPDATPAQLKEAVIAIAKDIWNTYYAPVFDVRDVEILAIYSHMVYRSMYLPDYPLGQIIAFQLGRFLQTKNLGKEMERMCAQGSITPDLWMERAVGSSISTQPMLQAADDALKALSGR